MHRDYRHCLSIKCHFGESSDLGEVRAWSRGMISWYRSGSRAWRPHGQLVCGYSAEREHCEARLVFQDIKTVATAKPKIPIPRDHLRSLNIGVFGTNILCRISMNQFEGVVSK